MNTQSASPADTLGKEIEAARNLLNILRQEEERLVHADVAGVSELLGEKSKFASELTALALQRHKALESAGFEASETGMQNWLDSKTTTATQAHAWSELRTLAESGREQNRVNGLLITQHLACNQNALNVLQGTPQGGGVYGPNGQSTNKIGGRRLVIG